MSINLSVPIIWRSFAGSGMGCNRVFLDIGGQQFVAKGKVERVKGWSVLFVKHEDDPPVKEEAETGLEAGTRKHCRPFTKVNSHVCGTGGKVVQLATSPPKPYTDGTLIAAMKNASSFITDPTLKSPERECGAGDRGNPGGIITTLENRKLIVRQKNTRATDTGCQLIDALPAACTDPGMTALWEQSLEQVAQEICLWMCLCKSKSAGWHISKGGEMPLALDLPPMPSCPSCHGKMVLRESSKGRFWSCQRYPDL